MSGTDLASIARDVVAMARAGEQLEAYVVRSRDTEVKVFDGEVESLAVAEVDGVGVRLLIGPSPGLRVGRLARRGRRGRDRRRGP